jgi:orotate phosphoribosyltransferase
MTNAFSPTDLADLYKSMGVIHLNRQNGFTVRGMRISPFYIDGMRVSTSVNGLSMVTEMMFRRLESETFDVVGAPSISGIPYASVLAHQFGKRLVIDRGLPSKHGLKRRIEGEVRSGDRVVVVDDIAKRGQTLIEISTELRQMGASIEMALVAIDATGSAEKTLLESLNIKLQSLISLNDIGISLDLQLDQSNQP